jgi:ABC-2 type transport system permease protein
MHRIWLIARREIVAYAGVPSFWVALLMGPLLMGLATAGMGAMNRPAAEPPAQVISVQAPDAELAAAVKGSLSEAAELESRRVRVVDAAAGLAAATRVRLETAEPSAALYVEGQRLSRVTLALLQRDVAAVLRKHAPDRSASGAAVEVHTMAPAVAQAAKPQDAGRLARFSMSTMLWLALVGSLGMLLQAVVRERSNRALESLLSAARPSEIVFGKLVGVGALALIVSGVWLIGGAALAATPLAAQSPVTSLFMQEFAQARSVLFGGALFVLAFAMYGSAMIGVGALARDVAAAQNLSRPLFGVLLLVFFMSLGQVAGMGAGALSTVALLPPFAPFALILAGPDAVEGWRLAVSVAGMLLTTSLSLWLASQALKGELRLKPAFLRRKAALSAA